MTCFSLSTPRFQTALKLSLLTALASTSFGCAESGSGFIEERTVEVQAYDRITVADSIDATVVVGSKFGVVVRADDNMIDDVEITQNGSHVEARFTRGHVNDVTLRVEFTLPELSAATVSDSSRLVAGSTILGDEVSFTVSDSSNFSLVAEVNEVADRMNLICSDSSHCELDLVTDRASVILSDSSSVDLSGVVAEMQATVSDSSYLDAGGFHASEVDMTVSNSSSADIDASKRAAGSATDSSHVTVRGGGSVDISAGESSSVDIE